MEIKKFAVRHLPEPILKTASFGRHLMHGRFATVVFNSPPEPSVKQQIVKHYGKRYSADTLVETGTYHGDMIEACKEDFLEIYSVELDDGNYARSSERFIGNNSIHIMHGDSGKLLPGILAKLKGKVVFWLDGHYDYNDQSSRGETDTPILKELEAIFAAKNIEPIILIDDSRYFVGEKDYPTIMQLRKYLKKLNPGYALKIKSDIIRVLRHHG